MIDIKMIDGVVMFKTMYKTSVQRCLMEMDSDLELVKMRLDLFVCMIDSVWVYTIHSKLLGRMGYRAIYTIGTIRYRETTIYCPSCI